MHETTIHEEAAGTPDGTARSLALGLVRLPSELRELVRSRGQPDYRARQIHRWVYRRGVDDPEQMTDLPLPVRCELREPAWSSWARIERVSRSSDGTRKALLTVAGPGRQPASVEAVLIPQGGRLTACLSTQAGCAVGCPFCATGQMGFLRQLGPEEIAGQMLWALREAGRWPTHVVFMGMGEPLANYAAVRAAIDRIRSPEGFGLGVRRLTLSTAGLVPGIRRLAREPGLQVGLAVSLHAPDDALRDTLVPVNRAYPLRELMAACREYVEATRRRLTFEYVLLRDVNDRTWHARQLARLVSGMLCHVNLIPYNPVPGLPFDTPCARSIARFAGILQALGVAATVRWSKGADIEAACGQLRAAFVPAAAVGRRAGAG